MRDVELSPFWFIVSILLLIGCVSYVVFWSIVLLFAGPRWGRLEDKAIGCFLSIDPRWMGRICVIAVVLSLPLSAHLSGCWSHQDKWGDFFTEYGFFISLFGFLYLIQDLYKAKSQAEIIRRETERAREEERDEHYRYCLNNANMLLREAIVLLDLLQWKYGSFKLGELERALRDIESLQATADQRWIAFADNVVYWSNMFRKGSDGNAYQYDTQQWMETHHALASAFGVVLARVFRREERTP